MFKSQYNHEGYLDMTAFAAMKNMYKGDDKMTAWHDGDIIKMQIPNGRSLYKLVVKSHERYVTALGLYDTESPENNHLVKVEGGPMYTDLGRLAYIKARDMDDAMYVDTMDGKAFDKLMRKLGATLGVPATGQDAELSAECEKLRAEASAMSSEIEGLNAECEMLRKENDELEKELTHKQDEYVEDRARMEDLAKYNAELEAAKERERLTAEIEGYKKLLDDAKADAIRAEAERDVYKSLYSQVLTKHDL